MKDPSSMDLLLIDENKSNLHNSDNNIELCSVFKLDALASALVSKMKDRTLFDLNATFAIPLWL